MEVFQRQPIKWILIGTAFVLIGCIAISLCVLAMEALGVLPSNETDPTVLEIKPSIENASPSPEPDASSPTPAPTSTLSLPDIPVSPEFACIPDTYPPQVAEFIQVVDGDTFDVKLDGETHRIRPIGMDTPERGKPLFDEATQANQELLTNQPLLLVRDVREVDDLNRLLRYVIAGETFVNYEMIRQGWALAAEYPPDIACAASFQAVQQTPQAAGVGIWSASLSASRHGEASSPVTIVQVFANGNVDPNEPDEFVEIRNAGSVPIDLMDWKLVDKANHTFTFPTFILQPGQVCRVYTNEIHSETCGFSFAFGETAIWNNGGDCAYLRDGNGNIVDEYCY